MKREGVFYGWIVAAVTALVLILSAGARSAPGVLLLPMVQEFGWSRELISAAIAVGLVMFGLGAPLSGYLIDRFGPRRITLAGLAIIVVSMGFSAYMTQVWQLNLWWGFLSGVGTGIVGSVLGATVASRWFIERRGLVTGLFGASTSAGQLVFIPLLVWLAALIGWRETILVIGGLTALSLFPVFFFLKDDPTDMGLKPYGARQEYRAVRPLPEAGVMGKAVRSSSFWLLAITFFICGATSNGLIGTHFIPHAVDCGLTAATGATILAIMGGFNFVGTIASGWLTDRYDPRKLLGIYYSFRGLSLLLLPFVRDPLGLFFFAVLFGLDYIATVPPTVALVADQFGRKNVGTVYGWVFAAHQIGAALASWGGGAVRDALGAYTTAFLLAGVIAVGGGMLALGIRRSAQVQPTTA
ncbi:MAG TPA: MFS transporter [Meiothermus sp.]|nr:MFS transporter [Meiothermus sp.]